MSDSDPSRKGIGTMLWEEASASVIHLAEELIRKYHPNLKQARIGFIFRKEAQKAPGGMYVFGQARKVSEREQVYLEFDFVIWVSKEDWERRSSAWCEALLDHELMHCYFGQNGWTIRPHDVQEFAAIVERHGFWNADLREMDNAVGKYKQGSLLDDSTVTMSAGGRVATLTGEQFTRLASMSGAELGELAKKGAEA